MIIYKYTKYEKTFNKRRTRKFICS